MADILLNDLLQIPDADIPRTRLKLNVYDGNSNPLEEYKKDPEKVNSEWLLWHKERRYFHENNIAICLLFLGNDRWLLTTIKKITEELPVTDGVGYEADTLQEYSRFFGRVILKYHNPYKNMGRTYASIRNDLAVSEILPAAYDGDEFPGYENIRLTYEQLAAIINCKKAGWLAALQNQKAVYLITDTSTGKLYVGSATAQTGMLLQRWTAYLTNGHGGNVGLKEIVAAKGIDYVKAHFQYSVLENYNARMDDTYILRREAWWKETLCSRTHGYNKN